MRNTITNWENGKRSPQVALLGKVVEFLRFNPFPEGGSLAERLVNYRKLGGLRQKDLARQLGIDPGTLPAASLTAPRG